MKAKQTFSSMFTLRGSKSDARRSAPETILHPPPLAAPKRGGGGSILLLPLLLLALIGTGRVANSPIPFSEIGARATADYQGGGLAVRPTAEGARLRCVFQRLDGEATREGLWLTSTLTNGVNDRFRVVATAIERRELCWSSSLSPSDVRGLGRGDRSLAAPLLTSVFIPSLPMSGSRDEGTASSPQLSPPEEEREEKR